MTIDFSGKPNDKVGDTTPPGDSKTPPADSDVVVEHKGRKYTKDDLLKKLDNADTFIDTLKAEREADRKALEELTNQVKKSTDVTELLKQLKEQNPPPKTESEPPAKEGVTKEELLAMVKADLKKESVEEASARIRADNWKQVTSALTKAFATKTQEKVEKVAEAHGLTLEKAKQLAEDNPSVFLAMFPEIKRSEIKPALPSTSNSVSFGEPAPQKKGGMSGISGTKERVLAYQNRLAELSAA